MINLLPSNCLFYARDQKLDLRYFGTLLSPQSGNRAPLDYCVKHGFMWASDNGCFSGYEPVVIQRHLNKLAGLPHCAFFVAPDAFDRDLMRGDAGKTLQMFKVWQPKIAKCGLPVALVLQDGISPKMMRPVWDDLQAVFIGGSTTFKYSDVLRDLATEAKERGKWVHMGRVNEWRRINWAKLIGCHSFDGTGYAINRSKILKAYPFHSC